MEKTIQDHVKDREQWELGREWNPIHKIFWIDMAFFIGLMAFALWQVWDYAMYKARAANKGYLFTGAHNLWRIVCTCVLALLLIIVELIMPGGTIMHHVTAFAMLFDAFLLYIHTEKAPMPLLFPTLESCLTVLFGFGVSDKGRMTAPIIFLIASFRLVSELWPLRQDEDAFKIVSAVLAASLGWHWFPLLEAINLWSIREEIVHNVVYDSTIDFLFLCSIILGHITVLTILWNILPQLFRNELAYELQDTTISKNPNAGGASIF